MTDIVIKTLDPLANFWPLGLRPADVIPSTKTLTIDGKPASMENNKITLHRRLNEPNYITLNDVRLAPGSTLDYDGKIYIQP